MIDYSTLINERSFSVIISEMYVPNISKYFTKKIRTNRPVVNGIPVSNEEYIELTAHMENIPAIEDDFIPTLIFKPEEHNEVLGRYPIANLIEMVNSKIPFKLAANADVPVILDILVGYKNQMTPFANRSKELARYLEYVAQAIFVFGGINESIETVKRSKQPKQQGAISFTDLMAALEGGL